MDRKTYLETCQKCAILPEGAMAIKKDVPDNLKVVYNEEIYYPIGYIMTFDREGAPVHHAILHSIKAFSQTIALLSSVDFADIDNDKNL